MPDWPFKPYKSPYIGTGDPPPDQNRKFKLHVGKIGAITPSNMDEEFTCPEDDSVEVYGKAMIDSTQANPVTSVTLEHDSETPAPPTPEVGTAPEWTARPLVRATHSSDTGMMVLEPLVRDSQWVSLVVSNIDPTTGATSIGILWSSAAGASTFDEL